MNHFSVMLRDHVTPVLKPVGFAKQGNNYRLVADHGDTAIVNFQRSQGSSGERVLFFVNLGVVTTTYWDWQVHDDPRLAGQQPGYIHGLWRNRVFAPDEVAGDPGPYDSERWLLAGPESVPVCGGRLAETLSTEVVPLLTSLLDREAFLAMVGDPAKPFDRGFLDGPIELMLLVDRGPSAELEKEIAKLEAFPGAAELVAWAQQRLAQAG